MVPPGTVDSLMQKLEEALVDSATASDRWMAPEGIQDDLTVGDLRDLRCILMALRSSLEWCRRQHREAAEKAAAKKNGKPRLRKVDGGKARAA
jgi:hypothetical protein